MKIVFDPPKRETNLANHGLDFDNLTEEFFENAVVVSSYKGRFVAVGEFQRTVLAVVFLPLGTEAISIVSMRRASRKERKFL